MALPHTIFQALHFGGEVAQAGQHQQKRQLGRGRTGAPAFTHRDATGFASGEIQVGADLAGLRNQLQPGQAVEQGGADAGAFTDQHQSVGSFKTLHQLVDVFHRVVVNRDLVVFEFGKTVQVAHTVLVVVGDHNVHGQFHQGRGAEVSIMGLSIFGEP
jgi:hypothetical protein